MQLSAKFLTQKFLKCWQRICERQSFVKTCKVGKSVARFEETLPTLRLTSAQAFDTDKTSLQNYPQPDDHTRRTKLIIVI